MWDVVRDGVQRVGGYIKKLRCKLQLCDGAGVSLPSLSSGQETPTVSAVSLTANEFPGGGVAVVYASVSDECLDIWASNRCMEDGSGGKQKEKTATRMLWEPLYTRFQDHTTGRAAFTTLLRLFLPALLCQAGLSPPCFALKPQGRLQTEAGQTQIIGVPWCSAVADSNVS